jgi:hypothetical protein
MRVEIYRPERKAEFLLSNAVDQKDYRAARNEVQRMGLDPKKGSPQETETTVAVPWKRASFWTLMFFTPRPVEGKPLRLLETFLVI